MSGYAWLFGLVWGKDRRVGGDRTDRTDHMKVGLCECRSRYVDWRRVEVDA